ncbi:hypothetical protein [Mesobacillus maritimus]|uniref:hypothetical protein n=1 Tax=Mesobacillus maritimus TaxID=1643336 RepID=UPI00384CB2F5
MKKGLITAEETNMGTLFTLLGCEEIQAKGFVDFFCPSFRGTKTEPTENVGDTNQEQNQEREKKEERGEKENDQAKHSKETMPKPEFAQTRRTTAITNRFIQFRNRGAALSAKDMNAAEKIALLEVPLEKILSWMEEIQLNYGKKNGSEQSITSLIYYESAIMTRLANAETKAKKPQKETLQDRIARLEEQGILG